MDSIVFIVMLCAFTAVAIIGASLSIIGHYRKLHQQPDGVQKNDTKPVSEIKTKATVVDLACWVRTYGHRLPKTVQEFVVVFRLDNGEELKLDIPEEMYHGLEKGQTGLLTVVDGALYGFEIE